MIAALCQRGLSRIGLRRAWLLAAIALIALAGEATADEVQPHLSAAEAAVLKAEDRLFDADVRHDAAVISSGFADEAIFVHANGMRQTKAEYLRATRSGPSPVHSIIAQDRVVRVFGDVAVVRGLKNLVVGDDMHLSGSYLTVYVERKGRWLMLVSQSSPAPRGDFAQSGASPASCENLARLGLPQATITMARVVQPMQFKLPPRPESLGGLGGPGNPPSPGVPPPGTVGPGAPAGAVGPAAQGAGGQPAGGAMDMALAPFNPKDSTNHVPFCRVAATLNPSGDSNIKIEVWLPLQGWNGKLMGAGNFGWAGSLMYGGLLYGLQHNFATVSTDTGHDNSLGLGEFALGHPDKMVDYGYRAAHAMTVNAKALILAFYGRAPAHSYWYGCSLGGQMGLTEIQRFPGDYDGAIVGAPASPIVELNAYQIWPSLLVAQNPARMLGREKAVMLHDAVIKACDVQDGAADGELEDPASCHFDPKTLLCKAEDNEKCLTAAQVEFVQMLYRGPVNERTGEKIFEGAAPGTEAAFGGYSANNAMGVAVALFKYMIFQDPDWDWKTLDMDKDVAFGRAALRTINEADNPNLKPFFDRGGKLLWYHGWLDGASPLQSVKYMDAVKRAVGEEVAQKSLRLFTMPGMGHCAGGTGCDTFDKIAVLDHWVESGTAPEAIVASRLEDGKVVRTHPICAYPKVARYSGAGDLNDAESFVCVNK